MTEYTSEMFKHILVLWLVVNRGLSTEVTLQKTNLKEYESTFQAIDESR